MHQSSSIVINQNREVVQSMSSICKYHILLFFIFIALLLWSCSHDKSKKNRRSSANDIQLLQEVPPSESGIEFTNQLTENMQYNFMSEQGMLIGAGVGILDINNDGLQDIFFAGNMSGDKLYLNKGNFKFEDVTKKAGIQKRFWSTGVAIADVNADGYDDIYVCKFLEPLPDQRRNLLYINQRNGSFKEQGQQYGLGDKGHSIMANFFDYDRDGDLDVYVANQPPNSRLYRNQYNGVNDFKYTDRLYRNDGNRFTDVTETCGIKNYSYSLSATTLDYNKDGWPDIYIACDYEEPDFYYRNNGNGTFTNVSNEVLKHMSNFSMGADVADINNDGNLDLYVADMVAEDNFRQKTNMSGMDPERFHKLASVGYHYQYMFNVLQKNNGDNTFSDIAQLGNVSNTDWSWSPLFIDLDQDSYKDLIVTNGIFREIRNKDFEKWRIEWFDKYEQLSRTNQANTMNPMDVINRAPSVKISNYVYKNNGDLTFERMKDNWGLKKKNWSQGSAYADFDNDGDLDLVINNTNMTAELYRNVANENKVNNYLTVKLEGDRLNPSGINATIELKTKESTQIVEYTPYRGYMSCSERIAHFGLGSNQEVEELKVTWYDNKVNVLTQLQPNQTITVKKSTATETVIRNNDKQATVFQSKNLTKHAHVENKFDDYETEVLLPYKVSALGPVLAKGDIDGNGIEDVYIGASKGLFPHLLLTQSDGSFTERVFPHGKKHEDGGATFFDLDGDKDLDLYVSSGGTEAKAGSSYYKDRLYINDGKGNYKVSSAHPTLVGSNGKVLPLDLDEDGDIDLIVAGRVVPENYGLVASSYILRNEGGKLEDVTNELAPEFESLGMVTDLHLVDLSNDGKDELVVVGEWMNVEVFKISKTLKRVTEAYNLGHSSGWWNTVTSLDIDNDGDEDLIAGNLGLNIKYKASETEPFKLYVDDFDGNGTNDVYLGYYQNGICYPVRGRQCSSEQMPFVSQKYKSYEDFGTAGIEEVLGEKLSDDSVIKEAMTFSSTLFLNENGQFKVIPLPNEAQISPINSIVVDDFNHNGTQDILLAGNLYDREVETTRSDAGKGCMLSYTTDQGFKVYNTLETGINAENDVRDMLRLKVGDSNILLIANNNSAVQTYAY